MLERALPRLSPCPARRHRPALLSTLVLALALSVGMAAPAQAQGVGDSVGKNSAFTGLVSASQVEQAAVQQYGQMLREAQAKNALGSDNHPQVLRLRNIARRIIPFSYAWNPRAREWRWEVNLIGSKQINAFCMPGGKIAFALDHHA